MNSKLLSLFFSGIVSGILLPAVATPVALASDKSARAPEYSLLGVYQLALDNDHQLQADRATYQADREAINIARSALLPQVNSELGWTQSDSESLNQLSTGFNQQQTANDQQQRYWSVSLSQSLVDMNAWYSYQRGAALTELAASQFAADQQELILRVAEAYFNVLREVEDLTTAEAEEKAYLHQWQQVQQRFDVGLSAITDVHEARAAYDGAIAQTLEARGMLGIAFEELEVITGVRHGSIAPLSDGFVVRNPEPLDRHHWVEVALRQNNSLQTARLNAKASRANARAKTADHYPTLSASASYQRSEEDGSNSVDYRFSAFDTHSDGAYYRLTLTVPIFSGLGVSGERRKAKGEALEALLQGAARHHSTDPL